MPDLADTLPALLNGLLSPQGAEMPDNKLDRERKCQADPNLEGFRSLIEQLGLDQDMVADLATSFIDRGVEYLEELKDAIRENDRDAMDRISHSMKGMVGNMQFIELFELNELFREQLNSGPDHSFDENLQKMEEVFQGIRNALEATWLKQT